MRLSIVLISALITVAACQTVVETSDSVILVPASKTGPSAVIIALNGALCEPRTYISFFQTVQRSSRLSLWIAFPKFAFNMPFLADGAISKTKNDLKNLNADTSSVFIAGHSLGGVTGQDYASSNSASLKGLILLGSYLQMKYEEPQVKFPLPVLSLSGELDGLSKIARMAISYNQMLRHPQQQGHLRYPVAIVPGATHSSFINGTVPGPVKSSDLKPEITNEAAWNSFSSLINAFIDVQLNPQASSASGKILSDYVYGVSYPLVKPLLQAFTLEGTPHLFNTSSAGSTKWVKDNVFDVMGITPSTLKSQIDLKDHGLVDFASDKPAVTFQDGVLTHSIYAYKSYNWLQFFDISQIAYESADYIGVKYKSAAAVYKAAGLSKVPAQISCKDLNQKAIDQVLALLPAKTKQRYQTYGIKFVTIDDDVHSSGMTWLPSSVNFNDKGDRVEVSSPLLYTPIDSFLFPGMFYCKLLSPARVAEWIYTDGLRKNYSTQDKNHQVKKYLR